MTEVRTAAVLGLGLIGGSLARDLRRLGVDVLGWDADAGTLDAARIACALEPLGADLDGVAAADLVVLAVPVHSAPGLLARLAPHVAEDALVTDAGSTKVSITGAAHEAGLTGRFVGSHPLAGDHRSGWAASREGLFRGRRVILTPTDQTPASVLERAEALWRSLGASTEKLTPEAHDREMAWVSHLPQATSSALGLALADAGVLPSRLGPGGRDMTRLAGSSATMWADILCDNSENVVAALRAATSRIASLTSAIERGELPELHRILVEAADWAAEATGDEVPRPVSGDARGAPDAREMSDATVDGRKPRKL